MSYFNITEIRLNFNMDQFREFWLLSYDILI